MRPIAAISLAMRAPFLSIQDNPERKPARMTETTVSLLHVPSSPGGEEAASLHHLRIVPPGSAANARQGANSYSNAAMRFHNSSLVLPAPSSMMRSASHASAWAVRTSLSSRTSPSATSTRTRLWRGWRRRPSAIARSVVYVWLLTSPPPSRLCPAAPRRPGCCVATAPTQSWRASGLPVRLFLPALPSRTPPLARPPSTSPPAPSPLPTASPRRRRGRAWRRPSPTLQVQAPPSPWRPARALSRGCISGRSFHSLPMPESAEPKLVRFGVRCTPQPPGLGRGVRQEAPCRPRDRYPTLEAHGDTLPTQIGRA